MQEKKYKQGLAKEEFSFIKEMKLFSEEILT